jgi:dihydropteroate synthase
MYLELGSRRYEVTHRAVVVGCVAHPREPVPVDDWHQEMAMRVSRASVMVDAGVDALDIGGASTGRLDVATQEIEQERLVALVLAMRTRFDVPLSICTSRAMVAAGCFDAGAGIVHDRSGFSEPGLLVACVASGASVVVSGDTPGASASTQDPPHVDVNTEAPLETMVRLAIDAGVPAERVMVDPTVEGPARSAATTWQASRRLAHAGLRVVVSAPEAGVPAGTGQSVVAAGSNVATVALGLARGCRVIRTHDVRVARRVAGVMAAVLEHR